MGLSEIIQVVKVVETIEKKKESRLQPKTKVNHMNTRTTKQTMQISNNAEKQLSVISKDIVKLVGVKTIPEIRKQLGEKVGSIISNTVRESYLLGFHFIESFKERTIKLTPKHIEEIDEQIKSQIDAFWISITNIVEGTNKKPKSPVFGAAGGPADLLLFNLFNKSFSRSALSMSFFALNLATIRTQRQVFKEEVKGIGTVTGSIKVPQSIWVSERDNRTCIQCQNLDGQIWSIDDPTMLRPVKDTHIGCRCRLLPFSNNKVFNA